MADGSATRTWPNALFGSAPKWTVNVVACDEPSVDQSTVLSDLDDPALVAACLNGRRDAFDIIVARHQRAIYQVCYRFVNNHEDASDLSQEIFVRAWRGLATFKGQSALSTWLYRIAINICLNRVSAKRP